MVLMVLTLSQAPYKLLMSCEF